jgi:hypothetical protein
MSFRGILQPYQMSILDREAAHRSEGVQLPEPLRKVDIRSTPRASGNVFFDEFVFHDRGATK